MTYLLFSSQNLVLTIQYIGICLRPSIYFLISYSHLIHTVEYRLFTSSSLFSKMATPIGPIPPNISFSHLKHALSAFRHFISLIFIKVSLSYSGAYREAIESKKWTFHLIFDLSLSLVQFFWC